MIAIKCENLTKKYKEIAVDRLCLEVKKGELFSLLGVNGAGKSTTIKMLSCLLTPTEGDAFIFGKSVKREPNEVKKIIAVSPQETAVAKNLTIKENLEFISRIFLDKAAAEKKTEEMLKLFFTKEEEKKRAKNLSGGQQRKLSIALALISEPEVLFLDEPTLGIDVLARRELWELIEKLKKKITIILTTHYMEEAEALSDRVAIMQRGRVIKVGTPSEIIAASEKSNFEDAFIHFAKGGEENEKL